MSIPILLRELMVAGTELWVEGGQLQVREPKGGLPGAQRAALAESAAEIVRILPEYSFEAPASYAQEALWLVHQANAGSIAYNTATMLHAHTALPLAAWRPLFQRLVNRHASLRTTFALHGVQLAQVIHATQKVKVEEIDCSNWEWQAVLAEVEETVWRPYDLERGPLFRVYVFTHSPTSQLVLICSHHIINDGFSQWMLLGELMSLYAQAHGVEGEELVPLQYSYAQFVERERQFVAAEGEALRAWWGEALAGQLPVLDLPTDYLRPPRTNGRFASVPLHLPAELRDDVRKLARAAGVSFFTVLLSSLQVLLHRMSGQDEIVVGVPTAGRLPEYGQTFGDFVNAVPVRGRLANIAFLDFLQQTRSQLTDALAHRDYPFALLVQQHPGVRGSGRTPIFQSTLIAQQLRGLGDTAERLLRGETLQVADLACSFVNWWPGGGDVDVAFDLMDRQDGLLGYIRYNPELFTPATVNRMGGYYRQLLVSLVADPDQRIGEVPMLTAEQRHEIVSAWNDTAVRLQQELCVHQLLEQQASLHPNAAAVSFPGDDDMRDKTRPAAYAGPESLTYQQLNMRANQVAHHLQRLGVGPETLVGICLERTPLVFVAVMGVLKAGAAYVPLDPSYPSERIAHMLAAAQPTCLLTTAALVAALPEDACQTAGVVLLDAGSELWQGSVENLDLVLPSDRLAYVIYTSGSTGQPKGAMVTHGNFANAYRGWEISYDLHDCRAHLQMASFSFDVFGGDMVRALCSGAKLVLCPRSWLLDAERLYGLMRSEGVECAEFVPAVLRNLVDYLESTGQDLSFMRLVIAGSDVWYGEEYRRLLRFCGPHTRLINSYGITETTIDSTFFELTPALDSEVMLADGTLVPIGRPFANVQIYILDEHRQPVPLGVAGDLYIGGAGVSRGYLNQPDLTASRFLTLEIEGAPQRVYSTGDRARWIAAPDGTPHVAFLGRGDNQVKIRGYRIELGEIESVLAAHPAVRQAVVVARKEGTHDTRLVAYIVPAQLPDSGAELPAEDNAALAATLRTCVQQKLPDYMTPAAFVPLPALPLTPNGKVDRRALPAPDDTHAVRTATVAPRTPTEETLAAIWCNLLHLTRIGIDDNFFEAGGHSLLALQAINRSNAAFQAGLNLRDLFDEPTVAGLAARIEQLTVVRSVAVLASAVDTVPEAWEEIAL